MYLLATRRNMLNVLEADATQKVSIPGVVAYSRLTGEEYSAAPGDYWDVPADEPLTDSMGEPMVLARRSLTYDLLPDVLAEMRADVRRSAAHTGNVPGISSEESSASPVKT